MADKPALDSVVKLKEKESFASVTSSIMMKIPTDNLGSLKAIFQQKVDGLPLPKFLVAVVSQMELDDVNEMLLMVADLIDFFHQVDINGDGFMEWEEFVMFTLDSVVKSAESQKMEKFMTPGTMQVQPTSVRNPIRSSLLVPALGKLILGVGYDIRLMSPDERSPSFTTTTYTLKLKGHDSANTMARSSEALLSVIGMDYLESMDILAVLRSDMKLEFFRFLSRNNYSRETTHSLGTIHVEESKYTIKWKPSEPPFPPRLLVVGLSSEVVAYGFRVNENFQAEFYDIRKLCKHKDFVRDVLIVNGENSSFIATASLDKLVMIWDINTLEYKGFRSGHTAGVNCLAYDGHSMLLAGGNDYSIVIWDAEASISVPLFRLQAHHSAVMQIVALGSISRCASLDDEGNIIWWDISKTNESSKRVIDTCAASEDHIRTMQVVDNLGMAFNSLYGVMIATAGRRQHVFKIKDASVQESSPVAVLYSPVLLSFCSIHTHEFIFWNGMTGDQELRKNELISPQGRITCAQIDDRSRRLMLGDSNGVVRFFNYLNGAKLKTFPPLLSAIKELIYTPDKNIIILSETSDIFLYDDMAAEPESESSDYMLRELKFNVQYDIVSIAYSHPLGLIATIDYLGTLILWNYIYFTPEAIIPNITAANHAVGQVAFITGYPLLVITDSSKNITVVTIPTITSNKRYEIWHMEAHIKKIKYEVDIYSITGMSAEEQLELLDEDEDVEEESGPKVKRYNNRKMNSFRKLWREVKCMTVHIDTNNDACDVDKDPNAALTEISDVAEKDSSDETNILFPKNVEVRIVCGYGDGIISMTDITSGLREINVGPIQSADYWDTQEDYNSKVKSIRTFTENDFTKAWSSDLIAMRERISTCLITTVLRPHNSTVISLSVVGEFKWILTCSEDRNIHLWTINGEFCGVLTRGTQMDKLFKKQWANPEDMEIRNKRRYDEALRMMSSLNLHTEDNRSDNGSAATIAFNETNIKYPLRSRDVSKVIEKDSKELNKLLDQNGVIPGYGAPLDVIKSTTKLMDNFPDRTRVICQLQGRLSYEPNKKEIAQLVLLAKSEESSTLDAMKAEKKKKFKRGISIISTAKYSYDEDSEDSKYLKTIQMADKCLSATTTTKRIEPLGHWKYGNEMAYLETIDPTNWDISSWNRTKSMYVNMHEEMRKSSIARDPLKLLETKLNSLCPSGSFTNYCETMKNETKSLRCLSPSKSEKSQLLKSSNNSNNVNTNAKSSIFADVFKFENGKIISAQTVINESTMVVDADTNERLKNRVPSFVSSKEGVISNDTHICSFRSDDESFADSGSVNAPQPPAPTFSSVNNISHKDSNNIKPFQKFMSLQDNRVNVDTIHPFEEDNNALAKFNRLPHLPYLQPIHRTVSSPPRLVAAPMPHDNVTVLKPLTPKVVLSAADIARTNTAKIVNNFDKKTTKIENDEKKRIKAAKRAKVNVDDNSSVGSQILRQTTFQGMMAISRKHKVSERNWVRKVKETLLTDSDIIVETSEASNSINELQSKEMSSKVPYRKQVTSKAVEKLRLKQLEEERLLGRQSFGPYKATELLQFFDVFKTIPKRDIYSGKVIPSAPTQSPNKLNRTESASQEEIVKLDAAAGNTAGSILLEDLLEHAYIKRRPHFKLAFDKVISKKSGESMLYITIPKALLYMCPLMTGTDRKDCIKFFSLQKAKIEEDRGSMVSNENMKLLKQIFEFFDTNHSGTVDRDEIKAALLKSKPNFFLEDTLRGGESPLQSGLNANSIDCVIEEGDRDGNDELDFNEFVNAFGDMFTSADEGADVAENEYEMDG